MTIRRASAHRTADLHERRPEERQVMHRRPPLYSISKIATALINKMTLPTNAAQTTEPCDSSLEPVRRETNRAKSPSRPMAMSRFQMTLAFGTWCALMLVTQVGRSQELGPPPQATPGDFAPVLSGPQARVTVNPADRAEVVQLYQNTYKASQGVASGWSGNRGTCTAGTNSQAYTDATILRVNYFRAMAVCPVTSS